VLTEMLMRGLSRRRPIVGLDLFGQVEDLL
jgi:hypothetical protein